jgi:hypothetical protein
LIKPPPLNPFSQEVTAGKAPGLGPAVNIRAVFEVGDDHMIEPAPQE